MTIKKFKCNTCGLPGYCRIQTTDPSGPPDYCPYDGEERVKWEEDSIPAVCKDCLNRDTCPEGYACPPFQILNAEGRIMDSDTV